MNLRPCISEGHIECIAVPSRLLRTSFVPIEFLRVILKEDENDSFQMVQSLVVLVLAVLFVILQVVHHMT